jgi:hypothetical protein
MPGGGGRVSTVPGQRSAKRGIDEQILEVQPGPGEERRVAVEIESWR